MQHVIRYPAASSDINSVFSSKFQHQLGIFINRYTKRNIFETYQSNIVNLEIYCL